MGPSVSEQAVLGVWRNTSSYLRRRLSPQAPPYGGAPDLFVAPPRIAAGCLTVLRDCGEHEIQQTPVNRPEPGRKSGGIRLT